MESRVRHVLHMTVVTTLLTTCWLSAVSQTGPVYSQYMFNSLVLNPAYAGGDDALNMTLGIRRQWAGLEGAPETLTFSTHSPVRRKNLGLGLVCVNDRIGVHRNLLLQAGAAYHVRLAVNATLSFGISTGLRNTKADYYSLDGNKNGDPRIANRSLSETHPDLGAGLYFRGKRLHAGISFPDLIPATWVVNDTTSVVLRSSQIYFFSKYSLPVNEALEFVPSVFVRYIKGHQPGLDVSAGLLIYKVLFTGVSWRKGESFDFLLRAGITPQLNIGYSYDIVTGDAAQLAGGSHEVTVNYLFRFSRHQITSPR